MKTNNSSHIPSDIEETIENVDWKELQIEEHRFSDGTTGLYVSVDEDPVYAKVSKSEGHGQSRESGRRKKWQKPNGGIETSKSGSYGDSMHAGGTRNTPMVDMDPDLDDLWSSLHEPDRNRSITLESDAIYHVLDEDGGRTKITRYKRKDDDHKWAWKDDVPEEDREVTIGERKTNVPENSDLNNLAPRIRDLFPDAPNVNEVVNDIYDQYKEWDLIERVGRSSIDGDVVESDKSWIKKGGKIYRYDHDRAPEELPGELGGEVALSFLEDQDTDLSTRNAVPLELGTLASIANWVEAVQREELPDKYETEEVLKAVRDTRNERIRSHVFGDISDFKTYLGNIETQEAIYDIQGVEATQINGHPRIESIQAIPASSVGIQNLDDQFVKNYLS